jgi:hypothetical protein
MITIHLEIDALTDGSIGYAVLLRQDGNEISAHCRDAKTMEELREGMYVDLSSAGLDIEMGAPVIKIAGVTI